MKRFVLDRPICPYCRFIHPERRTAYKVFMICRKCGGQFKRAGRRQYSRASFMRRARRNIKRVVTKDA